MASVILYDKPFLRYDQMIRLMQSRNIVITDTGFAKSVLRDMSYYTIINGYKDSALAIPGTDSFLPGTRFEELYTLHNIDVSLSHLVLKYILYIEQSLKSKLSYRISRQYGVYTDLSDPTNSNPDDYLCRANYNNPTGSRNNTLSKIKAVMLPSSTGYKSDGLAHYLQNHNHVPAWILTTSLSFGQILRWYRILKPADKLSICDGFIQDAGLSDDEKKEFLIKAMDLLREFRNMVAHGARTFRSTGQAAIPKNQIVTLSNGVIKAKDYNSNIYAQTGLYAVIATIIVLMNDIYLKNSFIFELNNILDPYSSITMHQKTICSLFNLPEDIVPRLKNATK